MTTTTAARLGAVKGGYVGLSPSADPAADSLLPSAGEDDAPAALDSTAGLGSAGGVASDDATSATGDGAAGGAAGFGSMAGHDSRPAPGLGPTGGPPPARVDAATVRRAGGAAPGRSGAAGSAASRPRSPDTIPAMTRPVSPADPPDEIRAALSGVRGLVLDADGVIVLKGELLPGAAEALAALARRGLPYRIVTNYSSAHRSTLAVRFGGGAIPAERFITSASTAAAYTATRHPGRPLLVLSTADARREFEGQHLLGSAEADSSPGDVAAVVIGDTGDDLRFGDLDVAFRCLLAGAEFVAMHRNLWWLTPKGMTLDSGALVAGLEEATGRRATVVGKPSPVVFRQAVAGIAADLGVARLPYRATAMVGDDVRTDIIAAKRVGLRGVLVLTGKHGRADVEAAANGRAGTRPDAVAPSLSEVVAALD